MLFSLKHSFSNVHGIVEIFDVSPSVIDNDLNKIFIHANKDNIIIRVCFIFRACPTKDRSYGARLNKAMCSVHSFTVTS